MLYPFTLVILRNSSCLILFSLLTHIFLTLLPAFSYLHLSSEVHYVMKQHKSNKPEYHTYVKSCYPEYAG